MITKAGSKPLAPSWATPTVLMLISSFGVVFLAVYVLGQPSTAELPDQVVFVNPRSYAVLGTNGNFRPNGLSAPFFNPTNSSPPFFQAFDRDFLSILGPNPYIREMSSNDAYAFAHEAPIYVQATNEIFFASNAGGAKGNSNLDRNNAVNKINLTEVELALEGTGGVVNVSFTELNLSEEVQMTNGGTGPINGALLFANEGRGSLPANLALVDPHPPYNVTVLLDNFFGRQFNSLNDVKVHPKSGKIFFTDVPYGYYQHFRSEPMLQNQVYRFDPVTGAVRVVADGFDKPNGIAFSGDGKTAYIADTGVSLALFGANATRPATIYAFDLEPSSDAFVNRRVFAYTDAKIPDGLQVDTKGNVYAGCGDGVQVWNKKGKLLGKFFLGSTSANMAFAGDGRMVILAETKVFVAQLASSTRGLKLDVKIRS